MAGGIRRVMLRSARSVVLSRATTGKNLQSTHIKPYSDTRKMHTIETLQQWSSRRDNGSLPGMFR